ncbi:MAG: 3-dehydroquinate synthase [Gemmatimonadaceae bacterium]
MVVRSGKQADPQSVAFLSADDYQVAIAGGLLDRVGEIAMAEAPAHRYAVISDINVAPLYASRVMGGLERGGHNPLLLTLEAGEAHKTRESWIALTDRLLEAGFGRDSAIIALGGGVVCDVAGFVAATFMRGVPVVHVPTSLLAMIDASLGGKTGVDTPYGKNLVGAFHQPSAVIIDPEVLETLPLAELRSGMAEAIKHGAIADAGYFDYLALETPGLLAEGADRRDVQALNYVIEKSVRLKLGVVATDEREAGARKALNFGHTIGHAIEMLSGYSMRHGEAVGVGMLVEAAAAEREGITDAGTAERIRGVLIAAGLPTERPAGQSASSIVELMRSDKKSRAGVTEYSIPLRIGVMAAADSGYSVRLPDSVIEEVLG